MTNQITSTPKLFNSIDIHRRSWNIHCSTDLFSGKYFGMAPGLDLLLNYVDKHFSGHKVNVDHEAGCRGYLTHRCFEGYGWSSFVVNPAYVQRKGRELYSKTYKINPDKTEY